MILDISKLAKWNYTISTATFTNFELLWHKQSNLYWKYLWWGDISILRPVLMAVPQRIHFAYPVRFYETYIAYSTKYCTIHILFCAWKILCQTWTLVWYNMFSVPNFSLPLYAFSHRSGTLSIAKRFFYHTLFCV